MVEAAFLLRTGWTEKDYLATSDDLIQRMMVLMNAEAEVASARET